jgi:hypothetical protein
MLVEKSHPPSACSQNNLVEICHFFVFVSFSQGKADFCVKKGNFVISHRHIAYERWVAITG